jgi:hypothetical protein
LLLLAKGQVVYWGPANQAVEYFESIGLKIPAFTNPCDWFMNITHINPNDPSTGNLLMHVKYDHFIYTILFDSL